MYLFARLFALGLYVVLLFFVYIGLSNSGAYKRSKNIINVYIVILAVMGFYFVPNSGSDLYRLFVTMHSYAVQDLSGLVDSLTKTTTPGAVLYYYIVGKIGIDSLLPAMSALITLSFCFYAAKDLSKDSEVLGRDIAIAILVFMSRGLFLQIISNIRTIMAASIAAWCVYLEFYKHKKITRLLIPYLLSASLHSVGQIILIYRIGFLAIQRSKSVAQKVRRIVMLVIAAGGIYYVGRGYLTALIDKGNNYLSYAAEGTGYSYIWERVLSIYMIVIIVYILLYHRNTKRINCELVCTDELRQSTNDLVQFITPLLFIDVLMMGVEFNLFQRLSWFLTILSIPLVIGCMREARKSRNINIFIQNILVLVIPMLVLACARGDLCSLKFFE